MLEKIGVESREKLIKYDDCVHVEFDELFYRVYVKQFPVYLDAKNIIFHQVKG